MQHLEASGAIRPIYGSLDVKRLKSVRQLVMHRKHYTNRHNFTDDIENYKQKKMHVKCTKVYYTHCTPATCIDQSCSHPQGGVPQQTDTSKHYRRFCKSICELFQKIM